NFAARATPATIWARSKVAPAARATCTVIHCFWSSVVPTSIRFRMAVCAFSAWPMIDGLRVIGVAMVVMSGSLSEASLHAHRLLTAAFASAGSRGYHYRLLAALREYGPASQARLGR